jgi:Fibronectin type III domain/Putative Ig domain
MIYMSFGSAGSVQAVTSPCNPTAPAPTNTDPGTVVLADNFETNDFSKWTTVTQLGDATATVQSAISNSPACAAQISVTGDSGSEANVVKNLPASAGEVWASGWFDITREGNASNNNVPTLRFFNGSNRLFDVSRQNGSGSLFVRWPTGSSFTIIGVGHIAVGQKFALKIHLVVNGAQSQVQVWQDGTKLFDRSNSTTGFIDLGSNTSMNVLQLGAEHFAQDGDMIADDIILKTVAAGIPAAPVFTAATPPATATAGAAYTYTFTASGTPAPTLKVSSGALPPGLSLDATSGVLSGTPTTAGPATFTVTATNGVSPDAVTPSITITVNPAQAAPVFTAATPPATATAGTAYTYTFAASGTPAPTFHVSSGALPAGLSLNTTTGILSGTPTTAGTATFTVTATNGVSPDAVTPPLTITVTATATAPAAPTGVAATAGNASATVSWTAPANGGSAITSYAVTPHAGTTALAPVTVTGVPPATGTTVTGLANGTAYTFTVTATNAVGTSPASAASAPVTPTATATAPAAPTGVAATAGNASATVSWTAPANGGSAITSYAVTPHAGTTALAPVTVTGAPPATGTTVTGLANGTAYTFTVTATNTVGTSPASAASAPVTPTATTTSTITNGGFESGLTSWTLGGVSVPTAATTAHTGTRSALLGVASGAEPLGDSNVAQTITVPATGTSTLSFWYQPHTNDDSCSGTTCQYDWMEAQVRSTSGTTLASLFKLCNNNGTWTQITADLTAYKGQTITLWFNVHLDGSSPADDTWMYLDDATLTNS